MIVADGMGGHAGGEVASRMAIATLMNIILHVPDWILRLDDEHAHKVMQRAADRCQQIHEALQKKGRLHPDLEGMGTTMTAALSLGDDLFVTQVGDSRAYLFRAGNASAPDARSDSGSAARRPEGSSASRMSHGTGCATC